MDSSERHTIILEKDRQNHGKISMIMIILDQIFEATELQITRIIDDRKGKNLTALFSDIHFFLICTSNLNKTLKILRSIIRDKDYVVIYKKYHSQIEHLNKFRDHLEHIMDGRIDGKDKKGIPLKNPIMLGNLINDDYDFGGETFNLSEAFQLCVNLRIELKNWNKISNACPLWNKK